MKKTLTYLLIISLMVLACNQKQTDPILKENFQHPTEKNQPRTWWRWLNGNISKKGITNDLEAIKAKGMNGVTLFNLGAYYPKGDVTFLSDKWLELFDFSVDECERLGLDFSFQMCDGWGASGGPWVTKDHAMKFVTSSKVTVTGGQKIEMQLPQPHTKLDYYKDIKVFAFPSIDTSNHYFKPENVKVQFNGWVIDPEKLIDGDRYSFCNFGYKKGDDPVIDFELNKPVTFSAINVHQGPRETPVGPQQCEIQYAKNGKNYTTLADFTLDDIKGGVEFEPVKAKYFRLKITEWTPRSGNGRWAFLSEVELLSPENITKFPKINDFENKASIWHRRRGLKASPKVPENWLIKKEDVLDISKHFNNGKLNWQAPKGHWTIVRMGYTLTGRENGPATEEGTGLECDKLSKASVDVFYNGYAGKMLKRNKEHTGRTITRLFADSFEALAQNWTPKMQEEFENRSGYSMDTYLLVLSGEIVESVEISEAFLYDLRKVLSEMLAENYYAHLNERCHKDNVKFVAQASGEQQMLANPILYSSKVDFPATEFWIDGKGKNTHFRPNGSVFDAISAAHIYSHEIIPTEAFTRKLSDFSVTPAMMKPIGDRAYAYGINQLEMHTYIHQPDDKLPGWQHNGFGISWGRKITWWDAAAGELTAYFSRNQSLLQKGKTVADILLYTGEQIPNSIEFAYNVHNPYELIPEGYKFDAVNSRILVNKLQVKDGLFLLPNGLQYKILVLPPCKKMSLPVLHKIQDFVKSGGIVTGPQPTKSFGLAGSENNPEIKKLAENIRKNEHFYTNQSLHEVFTREKIQPDFAYQANTDAKILFLHKKIKNRDVYFLSNQSRKPVYINAKFRQSKKVPEIWLPKSGKIIPQKIYTEKENTISMPLHFSSMKAKFVVFSPGKEEHITRIEKDGQELYPFSTTIKKLPIYIDEPGSLVFSQSGNYTLKNSNGKPQDVTITTIPENLAIPPPFKVNFDENLGAPAAVTFDKLISWTEHPAPGIKFYSGTGVYSKEFILNQQLTQDLKIMLDLGKVKDIAEVFVNDKKAKVLWAPDYRCNITNLLKKGKNKLEIRVTNTWNNRLAGDDLHPEKERFTFYPVIGYSPEKKRRQYNEEDMLESGLMGPVKLIFSKKRKY